MNVPHNALVLVCDGQRATLYRNRGKIFEPDLVPLETREQENPPTREQGTDKPGRYPDPAGSRSAVDNTDWHQEAENRFAAEIAAGINRRAIRGDLDRLILVAPPRTLGALRKALEPQAEAKIIAEIDKDLTKHDPAAIGTILVDHS
ncbi:MAG: host attachment protein [Rhodothalassiaceae bacterium]